MKNNTILERVKGYPYDIPEVGSRSFVKEFLEDNKVLLQGHGDEVFSLSDFNKITLDEQPSSAPKTKNPYLDLFNALVTIKKWNDTNLPALSITVEPQDNRLGGTYLRLGSSYESTNAEDIIERAITISNVNRLDSLKDLQKALSKMFDEEINEFNNTL